MKDFLYFFQVCGMNTRVTYL